MAEGENGEKKGVVEKRSEQGIAIRKKTRDYLRGNERKEMTPERVV